MNKDPFKEYIKESEPGKRDKGYAWHTAIGLQAVDGLKTSEYLMHTAVRNIEGEISFEEANALLQAYYAEPVMRKTAPRKPIRFPPGSRRFFPREHLALRPMNICPFTESCSPVSIPMQGAFGITTSRKRNGCLTGRPSFMAVLRNCVRHWTMTFRKRKSSPTEISQWTRLSITLPYLFRGCGRFMYSEKATPERQRCFLSNICVFLALT